jgi:hypothetical protein
MVTVAHVSVAGLRRGRTGDTVVVVGTCRIKQPGNILTQDNLLVSTGSRPQLHITAVLDLNYLLTFYEYIY